MEAPKKPLYKSLYFQVICAILLGIALGHFYPQTAQAMKPLGDGFIKLIKYHRADHFLHRGPRRRRHGRYEEARPYRRQSAHLF